MEIGSFYFNGKNSVTDFGIYVEYIDEMFPPKIERKIKIPLTDGAYDFGAKNYDERLVTLSCFVDRTYSRAEFREVVFWLSKKSSLYIWEEPEKYYKGELYSPNKIRDVSLERMDKFNIEFVCEPFAYKDTGGFDFIAGLNSVTYQGTRESPCTLIIKNTTGAPISSIQISTRRRK